MAKLIKADGNVVVVSPKNEGECFTLDELQGFVGGYIECINISPTQVMVINEEGKLMNLPYNAVATETFRIAFQHTGDFISWVMRFCVKSVRKLTKKNVYYYG